MAALGPASTNAEATVRTPTFGMPTRPQQAASWASPGHAPTSFQTGTQAPSHSDTLAVVALALANALNQQQDRDPLLDSAGVSGGSSALRGAAARDALFQARATRHGHFSAVTMANMLRESGPSATTALQEPQSQRPDPLTYFRDLGAYAGVDLAAPGLGLIQYVVSHALRDLWEGRSAAAADTMLLLSLGM